MKSHKQSILKLPIWQAVMASFLLSCLPAIASAVGLGEARITSFLGEPLVVEVIITDLEQINTDRLQAASALPANYEYFNLQYSEYLETISFSIEPAEEPGQMVLYITSEAPLNDPYLELLLSLRWPGESLMKEYILLVDLPPSLPQQYTVQAEDSLYVIGEYLLEGFHDADFYRFLLALHDFNLPVFAQSTILAPPQGEELLVPGLDELGAISESDARVEYERRVAAANAYLARQRNQQNQELQESQAPDPVAEVLEATSSVAAEEIKPVLTEQAMESAVNDAPPATELSEPTEFSPELVEPANKDEELLVADDPEVRQQASNTVATDNLLTTVRTERNIPVIPLGGGDESSRENPEQEYLDRLAMSAELLENETFQRVEAVGRNVRSMITARQQALDAVDQQINEMRAQMAQARELTARLNALVQGGGTYIVQDNDAAVLAILRWLVLGLAMATAVALYILLNMPKALAKPEAVLSDEDFSAGQDTSGDILDTEFILTEKEIPDHLPQSPDPNEPHKAQLLVEELNEEEFTGHFPDDSSAFKK